MGDANPHGDALGPVIRRGGSKMSLTRGDSPESGSDMSSTTVRLQRTVGLGSGTALIMGTIIGSGIFVSPKGVLMQVDSVGMSLLIWTVCGIVTLFGAHSFAELGCMITKSGGLYSYIQEAFGNLSAFVYLWASLIIAFPGANAAIALVFAENVMHPGFSTCQKPDAGVRLLAACAIALLTYVNCASVKWATRVQNIFTIIKVLALILIILTGVVLLFMGKTENFENSFEDSSTDAGSIVLAFYSGLFSYSGWYTLNFLVEELKSPYENLPRAIWISMPIITLIYVLTNVAYFAVLSPGEMLASDAVAVSFAEKTYGLGSIIMPILVACSTFGGLNGCIMSIARLFFDGAREGHLPEVLSHIHIKRFTPMPAVLFEGFLSLLFLLADDVYVLINCVSFVEAVSFLVCTAALLYLRWKQPEAERPIKVNLFFPIVFIVICLFISIIPIYYTPNDVIIGIVICISAVPAYWIGVSWKHKPASIRNFMERLTVLSQKIMYSVPQEGKVA